MDKAQPTADEKADWRGLLSSCVRKRKLEEKVSVDSAKKRARTAAEIPRLASYYHGLRVNNGLVHGVHPQGLEVWVPTDPERPPTDDLGDCEPEAPLLVTLCDEETKQWAFYHYEQSEVSAQWHQHFGQIHRRHNDFVRALSLSGVLDVWTTLVFELNIGHGPLGGRSWFLDMESINFDCVASLEPDHPVWLYCWPGICKEKRWTTDGQVGQDARQRFLDNLLAERPVKLVGEKVANKKWYSTFYAAKKNSNCSQVKLFVLLALGMTKGWIAHIDDIFRANTREPLPPEARAAADPPGLEGDAGATAASSSGPAPNAKGKAEAKASSSAKPAKSTWSACHI